MGIELRLRGSAGDFVLANGDRIPSGPFRIERLAIHYGMVDKGKLSRIRQDQAYGRGIRDFMDFTGVFATTAQGGEKTVIGRFLTAAQKRFGRFA